MDWNLIWKSPGFVPFGENVVKSELKKIPICPFLGQSGPLCSQIWHPWCDNNFFFLLLNCYLKTKLADDTRMSLSPFLYLLCLHVSPVRWLASKLNHLLFYMLSYAIFVTIRCVVNFSKPKCLDQIIMFLYIWVNVVTRENGHIVKQIAKFF